MTARCDEDLDDWFRDGLKKSGQKQSTQVPEDEDA